MERITRPFVEKQIERLNKLTGSPLSPYTANPDGNGITANAGCYFLDSAYNGWCLRRMQKGGGEAVVIEHGYYNLRTVSKQIHAFMEGYKAAQDQATASA